MTNDANVLLIVPCRSSIIADEQAPVRAEEELGRTRERADGRSASVHGDRINANGVDGFDGIAGGSRLRGGKDRDIDDARRQRGSECRGETFTG